MTTNLGWDVTSTQPSVYPPQHFDTLLEAREYTDLHNPKGIGYFTIQRTKGTFEWGTVYEVNSAEQFITTAPDRETAEARVADSPTDTGLVYRIVTPWLDDNGNVVA